MLHAIRRKKTIHHSRYLARDASYAGRVAAEDEITSTIFGPLAMFAAATSIGFWRALLGNRPGFLPDEAPSGAEYRFWPRFPAATGDGGTVEPDLLVTYDFPTHGRRLLLVELKWKAPLSGEDQLELQWGSCIKIGERAQTLHLFIAPTPLEAFAAQTSGDLWGPRDGSSRLIPVPWLHVRASLARLVAAQHPLAPWASLAEHMLGRLGVADFRGFREVLQRLERVPQGIVLADEVIRWTGFETVVAGLQRVPEGLTLTGAAARRSST
jgi:hypothetical protein